VEPKDRPIEQETVRTTIVGGRPPGSGKPLGAIPRGIEVLVKKAAVDPEFKALLLQKRAEAAREIGLALDPAEAMMLAVTPQTQLEAIIAQTTVAPTLRPAFLGRAAAVMLVALGAGVSAVAGEQKIAGVVAKEPPAAVQPADPVVRPAEKKSALPTVSEEEAAAVQAQITKDYLQALSDLSVRHGVTNTAVRVNLILDAAGTVQSMQIKRPGESGPVGFREELSGQIMKWKFPGVHRECSLLVLLETPTITQAAGYEGVEEQFVVIDGLRPMPPARPAVVQPASARVFAEVVAVTKDDATAMQARIAKEYQPALVELMQAQGAGGKTVRFAIDVSSKGAVQSVQFFNAAATGTPQFREALTGQILKWTFTDLHGPGAATVLLETTAEEAPPVPPQTITIGGIMPSPPPPEPKIVKAKSLTVMPGAVESDPAVTPTAAPTGTAAKTESAAPTASARLDSLNEATIRAAETHLMAGLTAGPRAAETDTAATTPTAPTEPTPKTPISPVIRAIRVDRPPAPTPTAPSLTPTAPVATSTGAAATQTADPAAAAVQARVDKEYQPAVTALANEHSISGKTITVSLALDAAGAVQSLQIKNPAEAGTVGFRDQLSGLIMKWTFPDRKQAGDVTVTLQTPKQPPPDRTKGPFIVAGIRLP
jgi:hypothetical protein